MIANHIQTAGLAKADESFSIKAGAHLGVASSIGPSCHILKRTNHKGYNKGSDEWRRQKATARYSSEQPQISLQLLNDANSNTSLEFPLRWMAATPCHTKLVTSCCSLLCLSLGDAVHRPPVSSSYPSRVAPEELFITLAHGKSPFTFLHLPGDKGTLWVASNKHQNYGLQEFGAECRFAHVQY